METTSLVLAWVVRQAAASVCVSAILGRLAQIGRRARLLSLPELDELFELRSRLRSHVPGRFQSSEPRPAHQGVDVGDVLKPILEGFWRSAELL